MPFFRRVLPLLSLALLSTCAAAQYSIASVSISGAAPYTDAEILAATGLHPGQMLAASSLGNAAQHLLDTGLFDDAEITLSGAGKSRIVNLALKPLPPARLMPASFANFVWFTPEELSAGLHQRLPLFRAAVPSAGNFGDSIQTALTDLLAAKGIKATVSRTIVEPSTAQPLRFVDFRIDSPTVSVASVTLTGAESLAPAELAKLTNRLVGAPYTEGLAGDTLADTILAPWRNMGFLNSTLDAIRRTPTPSSRGFAVTYAAHVTPGALYTVSSITWEPTPLYTAADFAHDNTLAHGSAAKANLLATLEAKIVAAYQAKGYLDAFVDPGATLEPTAFHVAYALHVIPGEPYRLKSVTPLNLSPEASREFSTGWLLKPGDLYNPSYVAGFIQRNTALQHLATYTASFQASADPQTHLVDLTITFVPGRTR